MLNTLESIGLGAIAFVLFVIACISLVIAAYAGDMWLIKHVYSRIRGLPAPLSRWLRRLGCVLIWGLLAMAALKVFYNLGLFVRGWL